MLLREFIIVLGRSLVSVHLTSQKINSVFIKCIFGKSSLTNSYKFNIFSFHEYLFSFITVGIKNTPRYIGIYIYIYIYSYTISLY